MSRPLGDFSYIVFGSANNDALFGDGKTDRLYGGEGSDTRTGNKGSDYLEGGAEGDTLLGEGGIDRYDNQVYSSIALAAGDSFEGATLTQDPGPPGYRIALTNGRALNIQNGFFVTGGSGHDTIIESAAEQSLLIQTTGGVFFSFFLKSSANDSIYKNSFESKAA